MSNTVEQFATELKKPVDDLLKQLKDAGVVKASGSDEITADDKKLLLAHLRQANDVQQGSTVSVINRKKVEKTTVDGVSVERRTSRKVVVPSIDEQLAEAKAKAAQEAQARAAEEEALKQAAAEAAKAKAEAEAKAQAAKQQAEAAEAKSKPQSAVVNKPAAEKSAGQRNEKSSRRNNKDKRRNPVLCRSLLKW